MREVTGSKLPILQHCQWWARDDVQYTPPERGAAAGRGITIHEAIDKGDFSELAFEDLGPAQKGYRYLEGLREAGHVVETEVPLALNYVTGEGRRLKSSGHRDYTDLKPNEIGLTVDYVSIANIVNSVPYVEVGDWKTGYGSHVDRASENWQLGSAAAALSTLYGDCAVTAKIHYLDNDHTDSWTFSAMEAQRFAIWIRNRMELVSTAQPNPGDHCKYCPARVQCPKTQDSVVQLAKGPRWTLEYVSRENDQAMVMALPQLEAAVDEVKKALKARYKESGLELPNGKVWRSSLRSRKGYDTKRMVEALGDRAKEFETKTEYEVFSQVKP